MSSGSITLVVGPMFAGKTTELMRRVKREIHANRSCCIVKYARDTRYTADVSVATHDKQMLKANVAVCALAELGESWREYDCIAIDEGQFFPDLLSFCTTAADEGKTVIVSALDGDFRRKPFGQVCELMPCCEHVQKITAVCMNCHEADASFTRRTISSSAQELIGGADMYVAVCRKCFNTPTCATPSRMRRYQKAVSDIESLTLKSLRDDDHVKMTEEDETTPALKKMRIESSSSEVSPSDVVASTA